MAVIGFIIGAILIILAVFLIFHTQNEMKAIDERTNKKLAELDKKEQALKEAAAKETQEFINRGCTPTAQPYVWSCPVK